MEKILIVEDDYIARGLPCTSSEIPYYDPNPLSNFISIATVNKVSFSSWYRFTLVGVGHSSLFSIGEKESSTNNNLN